jgi:1-phosphofructokinase family hexose kinase
VSQPEPSRPPQILAAGLSPAWQQIMVFDQFAVGEVNRACEVHWCGSGKVLNVGIALAHLGTTDKRCNSRVLSVIGARARAEIDREFAELGVDCRWIETCAPTRICTTIVERRSGRTTELVENAPPLTIVELARFREAFAEEAARADVVILTGSLPHVVASAAADAPPSLRETRPSDAFYCELLQTTRARAILDIRGPELLAALDCQPFCVKPNREELAATLGRDLASDDDLHAAMHELNDRGAQWVIVTQGPDTVWASHAGNVHGFQPPRVEHVVNPIGSGDCLAAGIAWATASGSEMLDAIRFGIAAAADNVGQLLPARLDARRIAELQKAITSVV